MSGPRYLYFMVKGFSANLHHPNHHLDIQHCNYGGYASDDVGIVDWTILAIVATLPIRHICTEGGT
jgi:hypothetical protein